MDSPHCNHQLLPLSMSIGCLKLKQSVFFCIFICLLFDASVWCDEAHPLLLRTTVRNLCLGGFIKAVSDRVAPSKLPGLCFIVVLLFTHLDMAGSHVCLLFIESTHKDVMWLNGYRTFILEHRHDSYQQSEVIFVRRAIKVLLIQASWDILNFLWEKKEEKRKNPNLRKHFPLPNLTLKHN